MELKHRVLALITKYGTPKVFIAKAIGVSHTTLILWLKGERDLSLSNLNKLEIFLKDRNC